jgi:hypothetical protein
MRDGVHRRLRTIIRARNKSRILPVSSCPYLELEIALETQSGVGPRQSQKVFAFGGKSTYGIRGVLGRPLAGMEKAGHRRRRCAMRPASGIAFGKCLTKPTDLRFA